jgi:hypothetical protein
MHASSGDSSAKRTAPFCESFSVESKSLMSSSFCGGESSDVPRSTSMSFVRSGACLPSGSATEDGSMARSTRAIASSIL